MTDATAPQDVSAYRWRVFVSSTSGLHGFRSVASEVIDSFRYAGMMCFEPVMMEDFGAQDGPPREVCADAVRECDLLVGILGTRYGDHPPDDQTSFTELEFQTAVDYGVPRLMFLLDKEAAGQLEREAGQGDDRDDRQEQFRARVARNRVGEMHVRSEEDFRQKLRRALLRWVDEFSFAQDMVNHSTQFRGARTRLLKLGARSGGTTLIYGEPGTGKTTLFKTLLEDVPLKHAYDRLVGPMSVRLAEGKDAVEEARAEVNSALDALADRQAGGRAMLPAVLIALYLEPDTETGKDVDPETLRVLPQLFSWDAPRAVVLAETSSRTVRRRLESDLRWPAEAVITVSDYTSVDDALEQMHRDAPDVRDWPEPHTRTLAEALGLRPISLFAAAKNIEHEAELAPQRVARTIRQQLGAIANEETPERSYDALIGNSIEHLSAGARELLALMTVLHPKPTFFRDEIAVALDLSLDQDEAIAIATAKDDELDADQQEHRDTALDLVAELVGRGLLERLPRTRTGQGSQAGGSELLTLHPANARAIHERLPLTDENKREGHTRAEAYYRKLVGQAVSGAYDSRFRMEKEAWWDDAEEWFYHSGHVAPGQAAIGLATLFFDASWWWDLYLRFVFCDKLLNYADRPRVQAISSDMPQVTRLLARFRNTYPRDYAANCARIYAEIAGGDPARTAALERTARTGAGILPILTDLCGRLGLTELDDLLSGTRPAEAAAGETQGDAPVLDQTRLHLLGLVCLLLAEGHKFTASCSSGEAGQEALAAADACYLRAEAYFSEEEDDWDVAWTRYLLGEVISLRGGDPAQEWDQAAARADEDSDTELLANIERSRADHERARGDLEGALAHYGRTVFYGVAAQVTSNPVASADAYTQAFYREMCLHATKVLAEPLFADHEPSVDARVAEATRRLQVMLGEWGGHWEPDQAALDGALRHATRQAVEESADAIAGAAFPAGPGDAVLGKPQSRYYRWRSDFIEQTRSQPWVMGLGPEGGTS
jgi:energy-coupling factor transporter ATP-binding protein EcfA2